MESASCLQLAEGNLDPWIKRANTDWGRPMRGAVSLCCLVLMLTVVGLTVPPDAF